MNIEECNAEQWHEKAGQLGIVVIIPTYNNGTTLATVIEDVLFYTENIIVVNDGSTDNTPAVSYTHLTLPKTERV